MTDMRKTREIPIIAYTSHQMQRVGDQKPNAVEIVNVFAFLGYIILSLCKCQGVTGD